MKIQILTAFALLFGGFVNGQIITNYTTADGLLADNVNCVDVDANDNIWFGTQNGVSVFDGATSWTDYTTSDGIVDNTIQAIYVAVSGDVWVGTDFGASVYNGVTWTTYTTADGLGNDQIKCITEDATGKIWFGTNNGASLFDGATTWTNFSTADGLPFGGVNEIDVHSNGDVWMGTGLSGVSIYDGSSFSTINNTNGLIDNRIRSIVIDGSDNKWIGTSEGITVLNSANAFSLNHTTMFSLPAPDTLNPVEDLEMDSQGIIWAGIYVDYLVTEGGVCAYNGNFWNEYKVADGLVGPVIRALAIDGNDDVWAATSTGVSKISDPSVGINDPELAQFQIYPNPSEGAITIQIKDAGSSQNIMIFDTNMKLVEQKAFEGTTAQFNLEHLSQGVYFVQLGNLIERIMIK